MRALSQPSSLGTVAMFCRHGQVREQPDLLDRVADLAPQLGGRVAPHALAVEQDVPARDVDHAVHHPHRRGLPAAGGADQHADLPGGHLERERVHGGVVCARVALRRVLELEGGRHGGGETLPTRDASAGLGLSWASQPGDPAPAPGPRAGRAPRSRSPRGRPRRRRSSRRQAAGWPAPARGHRPRGQPSRAGPAHARARPRPAAPGARARGPRAAASARAGTAPR